MSRFGRALERTTELESGLASEFARVAQRHDQEPDVLHLCVLMAEESGTQANRLRELSERSGIEGEDPPRLVDDLVTLYVYVQEAWIQAIVVRQAAMAARDREALKLADACVEQAAGQARWLKTRIKTTAPQALTVE
jgi:hypothetical protein